MWGATIGGMAALGPLAGGALTEFAGWRWIFLVNLPLGVIIVLLARRLVPESRDPTPVRSWDVPGVLTLSLGLFLFIFGLIEGQTYGWLRPDHPFAVAGWDWPLASVSPIAFAFVFSALFPRRLPRDRAARCAAARRPRPLPPAQVFPPATLRL